MRAIYGMDGGIKYDVAKALTLSVNSRDIFNSRKFISETHINNNVQILDQTSERRFATRTVMFTLSYRIGGNIQQNRKGKDRDKGNQSQDQYNQDDDNGGVTPPPLNGGGASASPLNPKQK
jgi:hypothetical protein